MDLIVFLVLSLGLAGLMIFACGLVAAATTQEIED
jgi:hypothetical protein